MRTTSLLVAGLVAASSVAGEENGRRRIYFPRHVKRQFTNGTFTTRESSVAQVSTTPAEESSLETKRQTIDLTGPVSDFPFPSGLPFFPDGPDGPESSPGTTTVVISSTIYVTPTGPTPGVSDTTAAETATTADDTTSPPSTDATVPTVPTTDEPSTAPTVPVTTDVPTSEPEPTTAVEPTTSAPIETVEPTTELPVTEAPPPAANSTAAETQALPTTTDNVVTVAPTTATPTDSGILLAPTGVVTTTSAPEPEPEPTRPLDPVESILSSIASVITSVVLPPAQNTTEPGPSPTAADPDPITTSDQPVITVPTGTGVEPSTITSDPSVSSPVEPSESPVTTPPPITTEPSISPPPVTLDPSPSITNNGTDPDVTTTEPPILDPPITTQPTTTTEPPIITTGPSISNPPLGPTSNSSIPIANTTLPTPTTETDFPTSSNGVTAIEPTATVTNTASWLPTTIVLDSSPTTGTGGLAPTTAGSIPTSYPSAITPENTKPNIPDDTIMIQIGFLQPYNYEFVVGNPTAAAQIFSLLPQALTYAGGFDESKVELRKLVPLDTMESMGYITTLAIVTYPGNMVEALRMDIKVPSSALYNNPNEIIYNHTQQINTAIDITLGSYPGDASSTGGRPGGGSGTGANGDPFDNTSTGDKSSGQQGATAGIVSGAVAVAAAYGAAMFLIARRYKRKRQAHRRTSSISNNSDMQQTTARGSPALMGGALLSRDFTSNYGGVAGGVAGGRDSHGSGRSGMGNSGRTQYISAPVAAENSLGWN